ncbi:MOSC domain-containing protein [Deinococcus sp. QL22]|uniref:MOSC domain-containing protein n=1 Tax=Deinococcus sp. QL22 TaxID=2939437 RepID=UPI002017A906|nr:MOSC N-terminal beta barrel domain-containing protein [Deinococcus sp. QL22]UQN09044.1 MOSC N-terminal beta barrel domain-containing protein [Deinococcus sp. QL22]
MPSLTTPLTLSALYIYPIKSAGRVSLNSAQIGPRGLHHDRRWMVVDAAQRPLTQRECPAMRLIEVALNENGLAVTAPRMPPLAVPWQPLGQRTTADMWGQQLGGISVSAEASAWFTAYLSQPCNLIFMPEQEQRWQPEGRPYRSQLGFADGNPFHLVSEVSVADLNLSLGRPVDTHNFRPNLVVSGGSAYQEDYWRLIRIGALTFEVVESCARCSVLNVTAAGTRSAEPLRSMARLRREGQAIIFGQHLVQHAFYSERTGFLRVGDALEVVELGTTRNPVYV